MITLSKLVSHPFVLPTVTTAHAAVQFVAIVASARAASTRVTVG